MRRAEQQDFLEVKVFPHPVRALINREQSRVDHANFVRLFNQLFVPQSEHTLELMASLTVGTTELLKIRRKTRVVRQAREATDDFA
jgi:hypothetical protein